MSKTKEVELQLDDHVLLMGTLVTTTEATSVPYQDGSADLETETYEIEDFHMMVYIEGLEYDLTKGLSDSELHYFKNRLLNSVLD